ncbi:MAG: vitamin B12-dependent ribonucleotide reductase [Candidatus Coatesbacteria bacterium]|nr:vitamin B12-dependent ribonucleotide reductase [Candidatus Coatesbacteria bacterium]
MLQKIPLSDNGKLVLAKRYLRKDENGQPVETPEDLFLRVAKDIAEADKKYNENFEKTVEEFYELLASLDFIPNSPTLMNAGRELQQLSACFVLPIEDSIDSIFTAIKNTALIHKTGGGTGFSFSRLRPRADMVLSTSGISSGPVCFMQVFDAATKAIKQGGTRRGANMGILRADHPDIEEFIVAKQDLTQLNNFNISVAAPDAFIEAVKANREYSLVNPRSGREMSKISAKKLFDTIINQAWKTGEPGLVFIDRINRSNPTPSIGPIEATNPCGEQPLLPFEACNLGSLNLKQMLRKTVKGWEVDYEKFRTRIHQSIHFLDNVIDRSKFPLPEIEQMVQKNRKIGLGIMGFSDMLYLLEMPYNSLQTEEFASELMKFIQEESDKASIELGKRRGVFPTWNESIYAGRDDRKFRNSTRTTIAPTGTISIIANCSSGIEPVFALAFTRHVMDGDTLIERNPIFAEKVSNMGIDVEAVVSQVLESGRCTNITTLPESIRRLFVTAHDISPEWHVRIQAAFQKHTDNAVSKTINFSRDATVEQVRNAFFLSYDLGCKGITIYRDGSREGVLRTKDSKVEIKGEVRKPRKRPNLTIGETEKVETGCGHLYVTINSDESGLCEVFATMGKSGACASSHIEAISRLASLALRSRIDPLAIVRQLKGIRCPEPSKTMQKGGRTLSCADGIAKAIMSYIDRHIAELSAKFQTDPEIPGLEHEPSTRDIAGMCPDCGHILVQESGCAICRNCFYSKCS